MRLSRIINKLKDATHALPDLIFYANEALFFKGIRKYTSYTNKEILSARIREKAHILEKDIYIIGKPSFKYLRNELKTLIDLWKDKFPKDDDPTIQWAIEILNLYENLFGD